MKKSAVQHSGMTLPPGSPKLRKLAVYGRRSSGKTCILTALAMSRLANPRGYSCQWISDHANSPQVASDASLAADDPLLARWRGKVMLKEQCERINSGELPVATELRDPLRLLYQFTKSEGESEVSGEWTVGSGTFVVELIDYSGELINPDNDSSFADKLMAHLEDCDGLLILAEATTTEEQNQRLHAHLELLTQVLPAVEARRRKQKAGPFPIALLLNKWDRLVDASQLTPLLLEAVRPDLSESRRKETRQDIAGILEDSLRAFFSRSPQVPQVQLAQRLEAVAGGREYFRTFCVSALGPCVQEPAGDGTVIERPLGLKPLGSYGLEDPFVWICQLSDQLGLRRLEEAADTLRPWHVQALVDGRLPQLYRLHQRLAKLYSAPHPFPVRLAGVRTRLLQWFGGVSAAAVSSVSLILAISTLIVTACVDSRQWARFGPLLDAAAAESATPVSRAGLLEAEEWVGRYAYPGWRRLLSYLAVQPQSDAAEFHAALKERLRSMESEERLVSRIADLEQQAGKTMEVPLIDGLLTDLKKLEIPGTFAQALDRQQKATAAVETHLMLRKHGAKYVELQEQLDRLLQQNAVVEASRVVAGCTSESQRDELRERFCLQAPKVMSGAVRNLLQRLVPDFGGAGGLVQTYRTQLGGMVDAERLETLCGLWEDHIRRLRDFHYYGLCVRDSENRETLTEYLKQTENAGFRATLVQQQLKYLEWLKEPRDWKVEVSRLVINYHSGKIKPDLTVDLKQDSVRLASRTVADIPAGTSITGLYGRLSRLSPEQTTTVRVTFSVTYSDSYFGVFTPTTSTAALGEYVWTGKLSEMASAGATSLSKRNGDDAAASNVVVLTVTPEVDAGIPEIQLPAAGDPPRLMDEELL
ncbi:MAG: hypothetical protein ACKO2P_20105 [Planctomycetota bacterium]